MEVCIYEAFGPWERNKAGTAADTAWQAARFGVLELLSVLALGCHNRFSTHFGAFVLIFIDGVVLWGGLDHTCIFCGMRRIWTHDSYGMRRILYLYGFISIMNGRMERMVGIPVSLGMVN